MDCVEEEALGRLNGESAAVSPCCVLKTEVKAIVILFHQKVLNLHAADSYRSCSGCTGDTLGWTKAQVVLSCNGPVS